jgi:hypothetical protein
MSREEKIKYLEELKEKSRNYPMEKILEKEINNITSF